MQHAPVAGGCGPHHERGKLRGLAGMQPAVEHGEHRKEGRRKQHVQAAQHGCAASGAQAPRPEQAQRLMHCQAIGRPQEVQPWQRGDLGVPRCQVPSAVLGCLIHMEGLILQGAPKGVTACAQQQAAGACLARLTMYASGAWRWKSRATQAHARVMTRVSKPKEDETSDCGM